MGIFRTAGRAAVAAHVVGNVQRRQQRRWAAQDSSAQDSPAQAPPPAAQDAPAPAAEAEAEAEGQDILQQLQQLQQLGALRDSGVLTEAEFEAQKARILASG